MECPKCGVVLDADFTDCPHCGVVVAKYLRAHGQSQESAVEGPHLLSATTATAVADAAHTEPRSELIVRAAALPSALILARLLVSASPGGVRMLTMWVHESGHAVAAWLCGYPAFPGPWITPVASERSPVFSVLLAASLASGLYVAAQRQRWFWVVASGITLLLMLLCTLMISPVTARQFGIFFGEGGCFALGTLLMLTIYAREDHPVRENQLRWAFLIIGALAFMDVYHVWSGPIDRLPFGENENGMSDPSVLTELYGWNVLMLIHRYMELARGCLAVLGTAYVAMLYRVMRQAGSGGIAESERGYA